MGPKQTRKVLQGELGGTPIADVFEWIDLDQPLGSASIAQVSTAEKTARSTVPGSGRGLSCITTNMHLVVF